MKCGSLPANCYLPKDRECTWGGFAADCTVRKQKSLDSPVPEKTNLKDIIDKQAASLGDKRDGIELRYSDDGVLDEILVYRDGQCCVHIEAMSEVCYWMSLKSKRFEVHVNCFSKNMRSHVVLTAEEA